MTLPSPRDPPTEFDCIDCGAHVFTYVNHFHFANDQHVCMECAWLRGIEDLDEREKLRALLNPAKP